MLAILNVLDSTSSSTLCLSETRDESQPAQRGFAQTQFMIKSVENFPDNEDESSSSEERNSSRATSQTMTPDLPSPIVDRGMAMIHDDPSTAPIDMTAPPR